jgi:transposase
VSKPKQKTEDRDKKIRYLAGMGYSDEEIANVIGLSPITVRDKRSLWGVSRRQIQILRRRAHIRSYAAQGLPPGEIAKRVQTSLTTVRKELRSDKGAVVRREKKKERPRLSSRIYVTDEEKSEIKQMFEQGASVKGVISYFGICQTSGYRYRRRWKNGKL